MRSILISEIEGVPLSEHGLVWRPVRHVLGIEAFGVNAYTAARAGDEVVEGHDELSSGAGHHEELYVVVSGHAVFTVDGKEVDAPAGTCVFLDDPAERRAAVAKEAGTTVLAIGGARGEPFRVSPWEFNFRAADAAAKGHRDDARRILSDGLARYPDNPSIQYNLACRLALDGDPGGALERLRKAVEGDETLRGLAATDPGLATIRDDPRFP